MNWEHKFLKAVQNFDTPDFVDIILRFSSLITNNGSIFLLISAFMLFNEKYKKMGITCMVSLTINALICNVILKPNIARIRPFERYNDLVLLLDKIPTDFSFPSGHTSASFAFATSVFLINKNLGIFAYIFAVCVAISRMYLMVHYPTDIVGGILLGCLIAFLVNKFF